MIISDPKTLKLIAPQILTAPLIAVGLLKTALNVFIKPSTNDENKSKSAVLNRLLRESFSRTRSSTSSSSSSSQKVASVIPPLRLAILVAVLSALRAVFVLTSGRWFYKNIIQRLIGGGGRGVSYFLTNIVGSSSSLPAVSPAALSSPSSSFASSMLAKSIGVFLITLSGILFNLTLVKAKQELHMHLETSAKHSILEKLSSDDAKFANPFHNQQSSLLAAQTLNDSVSQYCKSCVLALESCGYLTGAVFVTTSRLTECYYSSSSLSSSSASAVVPSMKDWSNIQTFLQKFSPSKYKENGLQLLRLFGLSRFVHSIPVLSLKNVALAVFLSSKKTNSDLSSKCDSSNDDLSSTLHTSSVPIQEKLSLIFRPGMKQSMSLPSSSSSSSSSSVFASSWSSTANKIRKWQSLISETFRQSQVLSSDLCVTLRERETFLNHLVRASGLEKSVVSSSSSSSSSSRRSSGSRRSRDSSSNSKNNNSKQPSMLSLFNPSDVLNSVSLQEWFIKNQPLRSLVASNIVVGLDSVLFSSSSSTENALSVLPIALIQSTASVFACASELALVSDKLSPVFFPSASLFENRKGLLNPISTSSSSSSASTSVLMSKKTEETSDTEADHKNNNDQHQRIGFVSLHRNEARLVGKVTVVESELFTGRDASKGTAVFSGGGGAASSSSATSQHHQHSGPSTPTSESLNNSWNGSVASSSNDFPLGSSLNGSESTSSPIPTLTNTSALPFHLYPGAGLLVATETTKIGETFISSMVSSIQEAFSSSTSSSSSSFVNNNNSIVEIITNDPLVVPGLSLADQITFPRKAREVIGENDIGILLETVGLQYLFEDDFGNINLPVCSGSADSNLRKSCDIHLGTLTQRQQLAVARVLFRKPRYVILWDCLFQDYNHRSETTMTTGNRNSHQNNDDHQQSTTDGKSSSSLFRKITKAFQEAGITVVSVFTCSQILDWNVRRTAMSCHFNGLFIRNSLDFNDALIEKHKNPNATNNNNNSQDEEEKSSLLQRTDSLSSITSIALGVGHCSAAFGTLQNPPSKTAPVNLQQDKVCSFAPETFLMFSRISSRSSVNL